MKGKFIVIEGIDASGKKTQANLLIEKLKEKNYDTKYADFPVYESKFGSLVGKYLRGEFGERKKIPVEIRCMLYAMDRYQFRDEYRSFLDNGGIIVANRYTQSNIGFQSADLEGRDKEDLINWIEDVESRMPQPDSVVFLHVPFEEATKLHEKKSERSYIGKERDIHEKDLEFQKRVSQTYEKICRERENWIQLECMNDGVLRDKSDISEEIYSVLEDKINF